MSVISREGIVGAGPERVTQSRFDVLNSPAMAMLAGGGLGFLLTLPKALQVWRTGVFLDPDDAMRAVEVRDLLRGQGWFDLVPHRLSPDHPFVMHWSRLVDVPLALLVRGFGLVLSPADAELAMRLVAPAVLFGFALWAMIAICRDLLGPRAGLPAAIMLAGSVEFVGNFIPGHIHHHGVQATLILWATRALLHALGPEVRRGRSAWAGLLAAASLGVGLQNLPFVIGLGAAATLAWVALGAGPSRSLRNFGLGLAGGSTLVFVLDVPPWLYRQGACDAFSAAHLIAAIGFGAAAFLLSGSRLKGPAARLAAACGAGLGLVGLVAATYPACLHDPMAGVDPILRTLWLADVGEALPLARLIALRPAEGLALLAALVIGGVATAWACWKSNSPQRPRWLALLGLVAIGVLGTLWQVRVAASTSAFLVPGATAVVLAVFDRMSRRPGRPALLLATVAGLVANGAGLTALAAIIPPPVAQSGQGAAAPVDPEQCFEPAAMEALAALPAGLVLSTIDPGSAILAETHHSVLAAPYHRNSYGNRVALLALAMSPEAALPLIEDAQVDYVALCRASNETAETLRLHPDSLSALLLAGQPPSWLRPLGDLRADYVLFGVHEALRPALAIQD